MKYVFSAIALSIATVLTGCGQESTSGGPGAAAPDEQPSLMGQDENTFSLDLSSATVRQGETEEWVISIDRGDNFSEDVSLNFVGLPSGVSVSPASPSIQLSAHESRVMLSAAPNAALGDFTVTVTGQPTTGANAMTEVQITVDEADPEMAAESAEEAADEQLDAYSDEMWQRWEQFEGQVNALKERAADAQGEAKAELDAQVAEAQVWLDNAEERLDELQQVAAENLEATKDALNEAFVELQTALN